MADYNLSYSPQGQPQLPVDQAYAQGINQMGRQGPQVGYSDWLNAVAHSLLFSLIGRGGMGSPADKGILEAMVRTMNRGGGKTDSLPRFGNAAERFAEAKPTDTEGLKLLRTKWGEGMNPGSPGPLAQPLESQAMPSNPGSLADLYFRIWNQFNTRFVPPQ